MRLIFITFRSVIFIDSIAFVVSHIPQADIIKLYEDTFTAPKNLPVGGLAHSLVLSQVLLLPAKNYKRISPRRNYTANA